MLKRNRNQRQSINMLSVLRNCPDISYQFLKRYILISIFIFPWMIAFKLALLIRLARFHCKHCKNTKQSQISNSLLSSKLISLYDSFLAQLTRADCKFLYMTTGKINFEKSKYLSNTIDACLLVKCINDFKFSQSFSQGEAQCNSLKTVIYFSLWSLDLHSLILLLHSNPL